MNPMRELMVEKVTLNMGIGQAGDKLESAKTILNRISNSPLMRGLITSYWMGVVVVPELHRKCSGITSVYQPFLH